MLKSLSMRERLIHVSAVMSLLFCMATAVLWVQSYWYVDNVWHGAPSHMETLVSLQGEVTLHVTIADSDGTDFHNDWSWMHARSAGANSAPRSGFSDPGELWNLNAMGFLCTASRGGSSQIQLGPDVTQSTSYDKGFTIGFPHIAAVVALAILPSLLVKRLITKRRRPIGVCTACGYDLRASPDGCPECGLIPAKLEFPPSTLPSGPG